MCMHTTYIQINIIYIYIKLIYIYINKYTWKHCHILVHSCIYLQNYVWGSSPSREEGGPPNAGPKKNIYM